MITGQLIRLNSLLKRVSQVVYFLILLKFHRLEIGDYYESIHPFCC